MPKRESVRVDRRKNKKGKHPSAAPSQQQQTSKNDNRIDSSRNAHLDYDSDDEPLSDERLDWRLDPVESLSDWTIETVVVMETDAAAAAASGSSSSSTTRYHVHKSILAVGARKCEYFARLFLARHSFAESQNATSRIELHPLAASCFPDFLDYLYMKDLHITTENATALQYLGRYFECRRLRWEAKKFWKKDMYIKNIGTYYSHAMVFRDDKMIDGVVNTCASQPGKIGPDLSIMQTSTPQLWLAVLRRVPAHRSPTMSVVVANFCTLHSSVMEETMFLQLTCPSHLPQIHASAALSLIHTERQIVAPVVAADPARDRSANSGQNDDDDNRMSNLQQRCLTSLGNHWNSIPALELHPDMQNCLRQHSSTMLVRLLASAQSNVMEVSKKLEEAREDLVRMQDELEDKDRELSRQRHIQMLAATNGRSCRSVEEVLDCSDSDEDTSDLEEFGGYLRLRELMWNDADSLEDDTVRGDDTSNSDNDTSNSDSESET